MLNKLRLNKKFVLILSVMFVISFSGGAYADIGLAIKLALQKMKAQFEEPKWVILIGGSFGTNTSAHWSCESAGDDRCEPALALLSIF